MKHGRVLSKRKTPRGIWALRGGTIVILLIVVIVVGTVLYSAYEDYTAVSPEFKPGSSQIQAVETPYGSGGATVSLSVTVPNGGLYTLNVTLTCDSSNPNVVCQAGHVSVPPGGRQVLHFDMTIANLQQYAAGDRRINGTVAMGLEPFVSITIGTDLSGLVNVQGA